MRKLWPMQLQEKLRLKKGKYRVMSGRCKPEFN